MIYQIDPFSFFFFFLTKLNVQLGRHTGREKSATLQSMELPKTE